MEKISPLGWVCIGSIIIIAFVVNAWMVALLRNRDPNVLNRIKMPRSSRSTNDMQKFVEVLRNPFGEEEKQLRDLSERVKDLKKDE